MSGGIVSSIQKAIELRDKCIHLNLAPQIRIYRNNEIVIQLKTLTPENHQKVISALSRDFRCTFNKAVTSCGFLKYEAKMNGIRILVNTKACFYGTAPKFIDSKPRTKAYCEIPSFTKENRENE